MEELKESPREKTNVAFIQAWLRGNRGRLGVCPSLSHATEAEWKTTGLRKTVCSHWPVQLPSSALTPPLPLHICLAAGCLPANAHVQRIGRSGSAKNSLQKAICILLMHLERQKSLQDQLSVQVGAGAALPPRAGGGFVPNTRHLSLVKERLGGPKPRITLNW